MAYTKYSLTPANNTATPPDGAPEGMLPSAVNDTMRDMMAQIRDCGDGIRDGTYTMTAPKITGGTITGAAFTGNTFTSPVISGGSINNTPIGGSTAAAGTFTSLSDSGNLTFTGTGNRITGDMSNATIASRLMFQNSTTDAVTVISAIPNGTATQTNLEIYNKSDPNGSNNPSLGQLLINSSEVSVRSTIRGSGTYLPLTMYTGGSERLRIDTSGNVGIGTSSPSAALTVGDGTAPTNLTVLNALFSTNTASGANIVVRKSNDTAGVTSNLSFARSRGTAASPTAVSSGDNLGNLVSYGFDGTNYIIAAQITTAVDTTPGTNDMPGRIVFSTTADGAAAVTERMRIDSSGRVGIATTSPATYGQLAVRAGVNGTYFGITANSTLSVSDATNSTLAVLHNNSNSGTSFIGTDAGGRLQLFCSSTAAGGVYLANGGTSWTSASDERVKENLEPIQNGLEKVTSLRAVTGNYIADETKKSKAFLIAQDVQNVFPQAVDSSNPDELGLAYTDVIPLLVAAIKEQQAMIEELKQEVAALKSN